MNWLFVYHTYDDVLEVRQTNLPPHEWREVGKLVKGDDNYPIQSCIIAATDEDEATTQARITL